MKRKHLIELREILVERFSEGELRDLCFYLGIGYADLPGEGKVDKARELVKHCERHNRIPELIEAGKRTRSDIVWPDLIQGGEKEDVTQLLHKAEQQLKSPSRLDRLPPQIGKILRDPLWQGIGTIVSIVALVIAIGAWFWPDIGTLSPTASPTPTFVVHNTPTFTPMPTDTPSPTTPSPTGVPTPTRTPTPTPTSTPDVEETLLGLIETEKEAVLNQDMDLVRAIFHPAATKTDAATSQSWNAIQRYIETFTTEKFLDITHTNFTLAISDGEATVVSDSCGSFIDTTTGKKIDFNCPQCDQWTFQEDSDGRWWITDFTYDLVSTAASHSYAFEDGTNGCWTVRVDGEEPQGQIPTLTTELAHQGQGALGFAFNLAEVSAHRGQTIRYDMPFAGHASAFVYAPPDAAAGLEAGFFAMELDHDPWRYHEADQVSQLIPGQWVQITWNIDTSDWAQPPHLLGIEVRQPGENSYDGYVLIDDVFIQSQ